MKALFFVVPCFEYQTFKSIAKMVQFDKLEIVKPKLLEKLNFIVDLQMWSPPSPGGDVGDVERLFRMLVQERLRSNWDFGLELTL